MLANELDYIIENKKFKRSYQDYLNYGFLIFPLAIALNGSLMLSAYFKDTPTAGMLIPAICFLSLGLFSIFYILKRLNANISFTVLPFENVIGLDDFCEKLKTAFKRADFYPDKNLGVIVVVTKWSAFSWGERVTIIVEGGAVLVNSQPCGTQPITIWNDFRNVRRVKRLTEGCL
jgi:hypothetical protein